VCLEYPLQLRLALSYRLSSRQVLDGFAAFQELRTDNFTEWQNARRPHSRPDTLDSFDQVVFEHKSESSSEAGPVLEEHPGRGLKNPLPVRHDLPLPECFELFCPHVPAFEGESEFVPALLNNSLRFIIQRSIAGPEFT